MIPFVQTNFALKFKRYAMAVEYDGSFFYGWQRQEAKQTVQALIEDTLAILLGKDLTHMCGGKILVHGSGRTDAGVHALNQIAHFDVPCADSTFLITEHLLRRLESDTLQYGLNFFLKSKGAAIKWLEEVPNSFHARFSALQRSYRYFILNRRAPSVLEHAKAWHVTKQLNLEAMHEAASYFIGSYDFTSFRDTDCQATTPYRTLDTFTIHKQGDLIDMHVAARSFLHHQVRIMVGTLYKVGCGQLKPTAIKRILEQRNRIYAGPTAPAHGLFFQNTRYPLEFCFPNEYTQSR